MDGASDDAGVSASLGWTLRISGLRPLDVNLQSNRLLGEFFASLTDKPVITITLSDPDYAGEDVRIPLPLQADKEISLPLGRVSVDDAWVTFKLRYTLKKLGRTGSVSVGSARVFLKDLISNNVIENDEGSWYCDILRVVGSSGACRAKLSVQLALFREHEGCQPGNAYRAQNGFPSPQGGRAIDSECNTPSTSYSLASSPQTPSTPKGGLDSRSIAEMLDEAWTSGSGAKSARMPSQDALMQSLHKLTPRPSETGAEEIQLHVHLHQAFNLSSFNLLALTGNSSICAVLHLEGQWRKSKLVPKAHNSYLNEVFEVHAMRACERAEAILHPTY